MRAAQRIFAVAVLAYASSSGSLAMWMRGALGLSGALIIVHGLRSVSSARVGTALHAALAGVLGLGVLLYTSAIANHHFVMFYAALGFALSWGTDEERVGKRLATTSSRLLAALMVVTVLQKLASPVYIEGSFFAYLIDTGSLGGPMVQFCEPCLARAEANIDAIVTFVAEPPRAHATLELLPVWTTDRGFSTAFGRALALLVLLYELWLACVFALAPRHRAGAASLLVFVVGLAVFREEWVFGALLCALGFTACPPDSRRIRASLSVACVAFAVLAVVS